MAFVREQLRDKADPSIDAANAAAPHFYSCVALRMLPAIDTVMLQLCGLVSGGDGISVRCHEGFEPDSQPASSYTCTGQSTWVSAESLCVTTGVYNDPDLSTNPGLVEAGTPCVFPFTYNGVTYDECTFDDSLHDLALTRGHSTSRMAGAFAARVRAQTLALTHFSTRYRQPRVDDQVVFGRKHDASTPGQQKAQVHASVAAVEPAAKREGADRPAPSGADLPAPCKTQTGRDSHSKSPSDLGQEALDAARDVLRAHAHGGCAREAHDLCVV